MQIEERVTINAPVADVWAFLIDAERVAAALPGAEISEKVDETTFKYRMAVRVGPVSADYKGTASFEVDEAARSATVHAKSRGMAGIGSADIRMTSQVNALGDAETEVTVQADVTITGVLAQFGGGMIQQVSKKMFGEFAAAVKQELEG